MFKKELQQYIKDHPETWARLAYFMCTTINIDYGYMEYMVIAQSVKAWNDGLQCAADEGALMQWCYEKTHEMGIAHHGKMKRMAIDIRGRHTFIDPTYEVQPRLVSVRE